MGLKHFSGAVEPDAVQVQNLFDAADAHGFAIALFQEGGGMPTLGHTLGLGRYGHAELIMVGYPLNGMEECLQWAAEQVVAGRRFAAGERLEGFFETGDMFLAPVPQAWVVDLMDFAVQYAHAVPAALQLCWPDRQGNLPGTAGFAASLRHLQPRLDLNADFRFFLPRNLDVYTTVQVLSGAPVREVFYGQGGDLHILCGTTEASEDFRVVPLELVVQRHPDLNALNRLRPGMAALRAEGEQAWETFILPTEVPGDN